MTEYKIVRHHERLKRRALDASLARPARDKQRDAFAKAMACTADAAPAVAPLGVLLWPGRDDLGFVPADLGVDHRRFVLVRDDRVPDWSRIYSGRTMPVFDPFKLSQQRDAFGAKVRAIGLPTIHVGVDACRASLAAIAGGAHGVQ